MKPYTHQVEIASKAFQILVDNMMVYLAMEERTGKTLTSILMCERAAVSNILVLTKKKALDGWGDTLKAFSHTKDYTITNYHSAPKVKGEFDLVILDEAHSYTSSFPKQSKMWKDVRRLTKGKPIIYLSATPYSQGLQLIFNQFALSDWSPFKDYKSGYEWFRMYGIPDIQYLAGRQFETYKKVETEQVKTLIDHLFITATREELGFEHEPEDKLHYVELSQPTREAYNILLKHKIIEIRGQELVCDTPMKLRTSLHMLEGGTAKIEDNYIVLLNEEKVRYIKSNWGDSGNLVIMHQYKAEKTKLEAHFKKARVLQATSFAEGVDLSMHEHLVIYSQDFSTAKHSQRRARQANKKRTEPIKVHFLLVKNGVSEQVYETVSVNKTNFIDSLFNKEEL